MKAVWRAGLAASAAVLGFAPVAAHAGGGKAGSSTNCGCTTPPPPPCNCTVPTGHQVTVPGVNITTPSVWISSANVEVQASASSSASASASASGSAAANAYGMSSASAYGSAYANGLAAGKELEQVPARTPNCLLFGCKLHRVFHL